MINIATMLPQFTLRNVPIIKVGENKSKEAFYKGVISLNTVSNYDTTYLYKQSNSLATASHGQNKVHHKKQTTDSSDAIQQML